jgi:hypothetical protein
LKCFLKNSKPVNVLIKPRLIQNFFDKIEAGQQTQAGCTAAWEIFPESLLKKPPEPGRRG